MRYVLRYTNDLHKIEEADTISDLVRKSDYLIHVWDNELHRVVWQNGESMRYGKAGVIQRR